MFLLLNYRGSLKVRLGVAPSSVVLQATASLYGSRTVMMTRPELASGFPD